MTPEGTGCSIFAVAWRVQITLEGNGDLNGETRGRRPRDNSGGFVRCPAG
jgi:hypothetical protein